MKTQTFEKITLTPPAHIKPKASIIWLHGLGADGHDFASIVPELRLPEKLGVRFILPHAPVRPVTLNGGMEMSAWFDLYPTSINVTGFSINLRKYDTVGIEAAYEKLLILMEEERAFGIPADRVILAGFSQGGALALYAGMRYPGKLGGLIALSTYFPASTLGHPHFSSEKLSTPIFMAHGRTDDVLPFRLGERSKDQLAALGFSPRWSAYPMAHNVCPEEIDDVSRWLQDVL